MEDSLQYMPVLQGLIGGIISTICFVALWLKTGHSGAVALLGILPAIGMLLPTLMIWMGIYTLPIYYLAGFIGWLIFIIHLLVFTFKPWPAMGHKAEATFE